MVLARSLVPQQPISGAVRRNICVFKLHEFYDAGAMAKETVSVRRRVFVVMPFGKKEVPRKVGNEAQPDAMSASEKPLKIDFDDGRVNFKNVDEKLPFALTGVSGSVDQVAPGRWQLRLERHHSDRFGAGAERPTDVSENGRNLRPLQH